MFKHYRFFGCLLLCICGLSGAAEVNVELLLKQADDYRLNQTSAKVISKVSLFENAELDKTRLYHVYTRPDRESLVVFKSAVEAGQKMLMLGDNYWLLMPKSRRPIRITPMQKLLGEASVGDISSLTWSQDYQGQWLADVTLEVGNKVLKAQQLELEAHTSGASYQRIVLWLDASNAFPLQADLYLRSGKLAKRAWFMAGQRNGELSVVAMRLEDKIQSHKQTLIEYQDISAYHLDDKYFNPAYLSRHNEAEL